MHISDVVTLRNYFGEQMPQTLYAYTSELQVEYIGFSPRGSLTSSAVWHIAKIVYNGDGTANNTKWAVKNSVWDNRESLNYE